MGNDKIEYHFLSSNGKKVTIIFPKDINDKILLKELGDWISFRIKEIEKFELSYQT